MSNPPERIWAAPPYDDPEWKSGAGEWDVSDGWAADWLTEYVRADTIQAQIDAAREAALREALVALQGAGSFGRTAVEKHAALEQYCLCRDAILALIRKGDQP